MEEGKECKPPVPVARVSDTYHSLFLSLSLYVYYLYLEYYYAGDEEGNRDRCIYIYIYYVMKYDGGWRGLAGLWLVVLVGWGREGVCAS
jgi:hypothetical protein